MQKLELITQLILNRLRNQIELERSKDHQADREERTDHNRAKDERADQQRECVEHELNKRRPTKWSQVGHG